MVSLSQMKISNENDLWGGQIPSDFKNNYSNKKIPQFVIISYCHVSPSGN